MARSLTRVILSAAQHHRAEPKDLVFPPPEPQLSKLPRPPRQARTRSENVAPGVSRGKVHRLNILGSNINGLMDFPGELPQFNENKDPEKKGVLTSLLREYDLSAVRE